MSSRLKSSETDTLIYADWGEGKGPKCKVSVVYKNFVIGMKISIHSRRDWA